MEGRHAHPSTLYPGGVGTVPSVQLFTDYLVRLMKYIEFMKRAVPLHDDLFDFFELHDSAHPSPSLSRACSRFTFSTARCQSTSGDPQGHPRCSQ
jgi:hypothetical protein